MKIDVVLPAGGRIDGEFAAEVGTEVKALIEMNGRTILRRTLEVLRGSERFGRIVVIGPDEVADHSPSDMVDAVLPEEKTGPDNIFKGLTWLREAGGAGTSGRTLILTTDLPFLDEQSLSAFLDCCPEQTAICAPVTTREQFAARFPDSPNEYVPLSDGHWTIGCAFLVGMDAIFASRGHIDRVFAARKSKLAMARLLGIPFIIRYIAHRLTVPQIENRCRAILGCTAGAIPGAPELAFDLDNLQEYRYARSVGLRA